MPTSTDLRPCRTWRHIWDADSRRGWPIPHKHHEEVFEEAALRKANILWDTLGAQRTSNQVNKSKNYDCSCALHCSKTTLNCIKFIEYQLVSYIFTLFRLNRLCLGTLWPNGTFGKIWLSMLSVVSVLPVNTFSCIFNFIRLSACNLPFFLDESADVMRGDWHALLKRENIFSVVRSISLSSSKLLNWKSLLKNSCFNASAAVILYCGFFISSFLRRSRVI